MSKPDTWMPLYIGDYMADTMHLNTEQHGAYLLLLLTAWNRGGRLPDDETQLALICRADKKAWGRIRDVVLPFFEKTDGALVQRRLMAEYEKAVKNNTAQKANGLKGGRPKKTQTGTEQKPTGFDSDTPPGKPTETPSPSPTPGKPISNPTTSTTPPVGGGEPPPSSSSDADQVERAETLAARIRKLEKNRGKSCAIHGKDPRVLRWVAAGLSDPDLREAYDLAVAQRDSDEDPAPINAGFLDVFVAKLLNQREGSSVVTAIARPAKRCCGTGPDGGACQGSIAGEVSGRPYCRAHQDYAMDASNFRRSAAA